MKKILLTFIAILIGIIGTEVVSLTKRRSNASLTTDFGIGVDRKPRSQDSEIAEAVLRHLLWNNGLGSSGDKLSKYKACFISADFTHYATRSDFQFREADKYSSTQPPLDLIESLQSLNLLLQPAPSGDSFQGITQMGRNRCLVFYISGIVERTSDRALVMAGYYYHPLNAGEYAYKMKLLNGRWIVEEVECFSMS